MSVLWLTGRDPLPTRLHRPVVWLMAHADADRAGLPPGAEADRVDAAAAKRDGGAPRLLRRRLLRALLASLFGVHPQTVRFTRDAAGAPSTPGLDACISTAGCQGWSAVAVAARPLGVDLELRAPDAVDRRIARWTLAEAYLKALGQGLRIAPSEVGVEDVVPEEAAKGVAVSLQGGAGSGRPARGWLHAATSDVLAAVVLLD